MEDLIYKEGAIQGLLHQVALLKENAKELADLMNCLAEGIERSDRVSALRGLKLRIMGEVRHIESIESSAKLGHDEAKTVIGIAGLVLGVLMADGSPNDPLLLGAQKATAGLHKSQPFGKVLVALAKEGPLENAEVVAVSRRARDLKNSEADIQAWYENKGYRLLTPDEFCNLIDKMTSDMSLSVSKSLKSKGTNVEVTKEYSL